MTGPEHHQEADRHLESARTEDAGSIGERYHLSAARTHATLALAAATMDAHLSGPLCDETREALTDVLTPRRRVR